MAIMGYLRDRMGKIVAGVIGLSLFAFIATEAIKSGGSFFKGDNNIVGSVGDEKIPLDEFNAGVEQNTTQFKQQSGQGRITPQITSYIQENTWNQFVSKAIFKKEVDKLGLAVEGDETQSMLTGSNPSPRVVQAFTDPQTGKFDPSSVANAINGIKGLRDDDPQKIRWKQFVIDLIDAKKAEKYMSLVTNGLYVNSLEAKDNYEAKNKLANFKYALLEYASVPDSKVNLTDADYSSYYDEHKSEFKNQQELRSINYVSFNAAPSAADSAVIKQQLNKLLPEFISTKDDSLFVQINSETKAPLLYQHKGELDPKIDSIMFKQSPGFIYGPYLSNGSYKLAKLVDERMSPDSVKARHILISPTEAGSMEKALARADSLKKLIESGKGSFASLAPIFSIDKASGAKGGELGTFGRNAMVPAFENAAFNGKKGDLKIVTSQFGVHLLEIEDQKGSSKVVKVATVDKALSASSNTQSAAYSKAQAFLISLTKDNFDAEAKKAGLSVQKAEDIQGTAASLPGLIDARDLVRWVFKSDKNDISDQVFTVGDQYVVARVTAIKPKGILPLDLVKEKIKPAVLMAVKGKMLTEKFKAASAGATSIEQIAQRAGTKVVPVQNIVFANPVIPGSSAEYKAIGTVFGLPLNKISKPIEGQQGVYVLVVNNFITPAPLTNALREKEQVANALLQRAEGQLFEALKDKDNVKDNRAKLL
ncbi:peptidylprolyl isomerase [Mucilaginibacter sp. UR6-11]|uniref:peptidylprolyl isomerase n=1 Tax=Mucilaginibacter sp. UR6-11 TaxID=1435644 RepID=UPI001E5549AE|nr:peptidylprolyl isomerase [Mucilaginibacter sp. UR6-11]MCC8425243.1 SurA N-terminal domain-containing protein [Mucilaginibacter sp. UR6-11]